MGRRERNESSMWLALANNILEVRTKLINGMTETFVFYSEETEARRAKEKAIRIRIYAWLKFYFTWFSICYDFPVTQ